MKSFRNKTFVNLRYLTSLESHFESFGTNAFRLGLKNKRDFRRIRKKYSRRWVCARKIPEKICRTICYTIVNFQHVTSSQFKVAKLKIKLKKYFNSFSNLHWNYFPFPIVNFPFANRGIYVFLDIVYTSRRQKRAIPRLKNSIAIKRV